MKEISVEQALDATFGAMPEYYQEDDWSLRLQPKWDLDDKNENWEKILSIVVGLTEAEQDELKEYIEYIVGGAINEASSNFDDTIVEQLEHQRNLNWIEEN